MSMCEDCLNAAICDLAFTGDFPCEGIEEPLNNYEEDD